MKAKQLLLLIPLLLVGCNTNDLVEVYVGDVINQFEISEHTYQESYSRNTIIGEVNYATYDDYTIFVAKSNSEKGVAIEYQLTNDADDTSVAIWFVGLLFSDYIAHTQDRYFYYNALVLQEARLLPIIIENITPKQLAETLHKLSLNDLWALKGA